jgi:ABC-type transport system involved in multi-copper enzyme maturation permease subunit
MRLIWKEMRECWLVHTLWLLLLVIFNLLMFKLLFREIYSQSELILVFIKPDLFIPGIFGLVVGGGVYNSELTKDRVFFAYSRPIVWWKLLIAKIIPGLFVILLAPVITFYIYEQFGMKNYHQYFPWNILLLNLGIIFINYFLYFILGVFGSPVFTGVTSGLFIVVITEIIAYLSFNIISGYLTENMNVIYAVITAFWLTNFGIIISGIILARKLAQLQFTGRLFLYLKIIGYTLITGLILIIISFYTPAIQKSASVSSQQMNLYKSDISPDAKYSIATYIKRKGDSTTAEIVIKVIDINTGIEKKFLDNKILDKYKIRKYQCAWLCNNLIDVISDEDNRQSTESFKGPSQRSIIYNINNGEIYPTQFGLLYSFSPDGKYIIKYCLQKPDGNNMTLAIFTFPKLRELKSFNYSKNIKILRWEDNNTLSYIDENGKYQELHLNQIVKEDKK